MLLSCGAGEDSWESLGLQGDQTNQSSRKSILNIHWKDWCLSWDFNTLATWCKELTHWKRPWCWERLKAGGEGDDRGWDGWRASLTEWTWVWASSRSWWWTGRPGVLQSMGSQRVKHNWMTEVNWNDFLCKINIARASILIFFVFSYLYSNTRQLAKFSLITEISFNRTKILGYSPWCVYIIPFITVYHSHWISQYLRNIRDFGVRTQQRTASLHNI